MPFCGVHCCREPPPPPVYPAGRALFTLRILIRLHMANFETQKHCQADVSASDLVDMGMAERVQKALRSSGRVVTNAWKP